MECWEMIGESISHRVKDVAHPQGATWKLGHEYAPRINDLKGGMSLSS
jgi:hypothetical protein